MNSKVWNFLRAKINVSRVDIAFSNGFSYGFIRMKNLIRCFRSPNHDFGGFWAKKNNINNSCAASSSILHEATI